jgi:hypothetical protein
VLTVRLHLGLLALGLFAATHLPLTRRPGTRRLKEKPAVAGSLRVKLNVVPTGAHPALLTYQRVGTLEQMGNAVLTHGLDAHRLS